MNVEDQVLILRMKYLKEIDRIYEQRFQMRLMSVMLFNQRSYTNSIKNIEVTSSIIERSCVDCNPKRIMFYLVILKTIVDELIKRTDKDYEKLWDNKLTH